MQSSHETWRKSQHIYRNKHMVTAQETDEDQRRWMDESESIATEFNETPESPMIWSYVEQNDELHNKTHQILQDRHRNTAEWPPQLHSTTEHTFSNNSVHTMYVQMGNFQSRTRPRRSIIMRTKGQSSDKYTPMRCGWLKNSRTLKSRYLFQSKKVELQ